MKIKNIKQSLCFISCILISISLITCQNGTSSDSSNQTIDNLDIKNTTKNDSIIIPTVKNQTDIQEKDKFTIQIYRSKENRSTIGESYSKYINFKDDLYITPFKKFNYKFSPEDDRYNKEIYDLGVYWFVIAGLSGLLFIVYMVLNRFLGKFRGSKKENLDEDFKYWTWGVFFLGFCMTFIFFTISASKSKVNLDALTEISNFTMIQSNNAYNYIQKMEKSQQELNNLNYKLTSKNDDFDLKIFEFNNIKLDAEKTKAKSTKLADEIRGKESMKFTLEINILVFVSLLTLIGLFCFKKGKKKFVIFISLLIYLLLIPILVIQGYSFSFFIYSIDMCKDVLNIVKKDIEPRQEKGIGYFISCPAKIVRKNLYTSKYILSKSFDDLFEDLNLNIVKNYPQQTLGDYKRNDTHFQFLAGNLTFDNNNSTIKNGLKSLVELNSILKGLESLSQCEYALSSINYIEEKYCSVSLDIQSLSMISYLIGVIGILFVSIGFNKASVLIDENGVKASHVAFMESLN